MPADLTIFAAKYFVFIEALVAAVLLLPVLYRRSAVTVLWWGVTAVLLCVLGYVFAHIGAAVYTDPRPFTIDHVKPLIPHAPDNGFPSDHALLAAVLVALVGVVSPLRALPVAALAVLVDWARVGAGIHHVADVFGSTLFIGLATAVALAVVPLIVRRIRPYVPRWSIEEMVGRVLDKRGAGAPLRHAVADVYQESATAARSHMRS